MRRIYRAVMASPRKAVAMFGALVVAAAVVIGSGAAFNSSTANPDNTFSAGNLSQSNSKDGAAILTASGLQPGGNAQGTVDIANTGDGAADFTLASSDLVDTPAAPAFSAKLDLLVEDCGAPSGGCASPATVYTGKLGSLGTEALGEFAAGEAHRYRFTVTFPDGGTPSGPTSGDNAYKGAETSIQFDWEAVGS